jgi:glycosyltransferase involved in cell wall biosynthesis
MTECREANERTTVRELLGLSSSPFSATEISIRRMISSPGDVPLVTFVVPVHNQGKIIRENLQSIQECATTPHEFIIINDASVDDSAREVLSWIGQDSPGLLTRAITYVESQSDVFETICDSIGVELASGQFIVEIQADMKLHDNGFDQLMVAALQQNEDVFAVSGRGIHPLSDVVSNRTSRGVIITQKFSSGFRRLVSLLRGSGAYKPSPAIFKFLGEEGRLGEHINRPVAPAAETRSLYVGGTVMRGPLAFRKSEFETLGGFDLERFFLGNDDHDLLARAAGTLTKTGAYVPIDFDSPTNLGSTRQAREPAKEERYRELKCHFEAKRATSYLERSSGLPAPRRDVRPLEPLPV